MTVAFLYKWTQLSTEKWYIGSRTAKNCHPDDGYICSSKLVKPLIKKLNKKTCEYCLNLFSPALYGRWHGINCKNNKVSENE